jgi:hypothetical protein
MAAHDCPTPDEPCECDLPVTPLHVRVAEALGCKPEAPPSRYQVDYWVCTCEDQAHQFDGGAYYVARYDTDWSATGPLLERFVGAIHEYVGSDGRLWWAVLPKEGVDQDALDTRGPDHSLLVAVCNLIIALAEAGKLPR